MKWGIGFANTSGFVEPTGAAELGRAAEAAGVESLWTVEHVVFPDGYESTYPYSGSGRMPMRSDTPTPDPLVWLTWVAAHTSTIRLATGILILPERNPVVLAKELATLDQLSGGRVELGIGVGWLREEFDALGIPWERRGARTDEYVSVLRTLWSGDSVSHQGEFVSFTGVSSNPKPTQTPIPIVIGGHSEAAARRAGRLGDGFHPAGGDIPALVALARSVAAEHGRDPDALEITVPAPRDLTDRDDPVGTIEALAAQGIHRLIVPAFWFHRDPVADLARFGGAIIAPTAEL